VDSSAAVENLSGKSTPFDRNFVRSSAVINQLLSFLIPALFFAIYFYRNNWAKFLQLIDFPKLSNLFIGAMLMIATLPLVMFASWINLKIPLPEWAVELEEMTAELIENLLRVEQPYELWLNIFVVAVVPAICEELLFRGVIQKKLYGWVQNPHYVAIFGHFVNNALSVVAMYLYQKGEIDVNFENTDDINWGLTIVSLVVVLFLANTMIKNNNKNTGGDLIT